MLSDKKKNLLRISKIEQLQNNWNGNSASKFSSELLSYVREIIECSNIQGSIFPTARNSIQIEYENSRGDYLEFKIFEDKRIKFFLLENSGGDSTEYINCNDINRVVNYLSFLITIHAFFHNKCITQRKD